MFAHIETYPGDPILSLMEAYINDKRVSKVNLSIGLYYDENGNVPLLESIKNAKSNLYGREQSPLLYLPMQGHQEYCDNVQKLLFGKDSTLIREKQVASIQTLGGSGALKVGADFLKKWFPTSTVWVSDPTWENHIAIFEGAGLAVRKYPYFDPSTNQVNFEGMVQFLSQLPSNSVVLLHPCCHNPTGADLSPKQWDIIIPIIAERGLIPFVDMAYFGLGKDLQDDLYAIHAMVDRGINFLLSTSFSKIFSLYGERVGALSVVCHAEEEAARVLGQLKAMVRRNYSSPPSYGAKLVNEVLGDANLRGLWLEEVDQMRIRMRTMRHKLFDILCLEGADPSRYRFLIDQQGMFSFTGFTAMQVQQLRENYGVYMVGSGRMCIAGLNSNNLERVARAMLAVEQVADIQIV
ncbi:aromatic amino acid transaminase [Sphingobacterium sp. LRF_L2]|uniref:amino acid aminotransferase n=1 Tax=Sphingobacterium sp. LRF_L2 TaxID=3369421 RepID=UPI003F6328ED